MIETLERISVGDISIDADWLMVDNERYSIYEQQVGEVVNSITVLKPHQCTRGHQHRHWESYTFAEDGLTIYLNGMGKDVTSPQTLEIPPKVHHVVRNNTDQPIAFLCQWLASDVNKGH